MAHRPRLLYICVKDDVRETLSGSSPVRDASTRQVHPRYTRSLLSSTLLLMGCKPRHAFKISNRAFEILSRELSSKSLQESVEATFSKLKVVMSMPAGLDTLTESGKPDEGLSSEDSSNFRGASFGQSERLQKVAGSDSNLPPFQLGMKRIGVRPEIMQINTFQLREKSSESVLSSERVLRMPSRNEGDDKSQLNKGQPKTSKASRRSVDITRKKFLDIVCQALAEYHYVGPNQRSDLMVACSVREHRTSVTVLLCGTSGCGKSTLSSLLASRLGITTVVSTDSIRHMMRSFISEEDNPLLWASTYHAGECLDPEAVAEAKAKKKALKLPGLHEDARAKGVHLFEGDHHGDDGVLPDDSSKGGTDGEFKRASNVDGERELLWKEEGSLAGKRTSSNASGCIGSEDLETVLNEKELTVQGFKAQSEMVIDSLDRLITQWEQRRESAVVEGVHLSLNFVMSLMKKHPSIIPFMVYISNETKHLERFAVRAKYMTLDPARNKYVKYIRNIRTIQDYLCKRADKHLVPKVNNTNVDKSVAAIHATVFACLRRCAAGETLYDQAHNTVPIIHEEYQSQYAASGWSSKGMFQLIQLQGVNRNSLSLVHANGPMTKVWPIAIENTGGVLLPTAGKVMNRSELLSHTKLLTSELLSVSEQPICEECGGGILPSKQKTSTTGCNHKGKSGVNSAAETIQLFNRDTYLQQQQEELAAATSGPGLEDAGSASGSSYTLESRADSEDVWNSYVKNKGLHPSKNSGEDNSTINPEVMTADGIIERQADVAMVGKRVVPFSSPRPIASNRRPIKNSSCFVSGPMGPTSPVHVRFGGHGLSQCGTEPRGCSTCNSSVEGLSSTGATLLAFESSSGTEATGVDSYSAEKTGSTSQEVADDAVAMSESDEEPETNGSDEDDDQKYMMDELEEGSVDEEESYMQSDDEQELRSGDEHDDEGGWFDGEEDCLDDDDVFYNWSNNRGAEVSQSFLLPQLLLSSNSSIKEMGSPPSEAIPGLGSDLNSTHIRGIAEMKRQGIYKSVSTSALSERQQRRHSDDGRSLILTTRSRPFVGVKEGIPSNFDRRRRGVPSRGLTFSADAQTPQVGISGEHGVWVKRVSVRPSDGKFSMESKELSEGDNYERVAGNMDDGSMGDSLNRQQNRAKYLENVKVGKPGILDLHGKAERNSHIQLRSNDNSNEGRWVPSRPRKEDDVCVQGRRVTSQVPLMFRKRTASAS